MRKLFVAALLLTFLHLGLAWAGIDPAAAQKLLATDGASGDYFGYSVSVDGNTALIGASWDDDKGIDSGSAYIFVRAANGTWNQQAKLTAGDGVAYDYFGISVSLSGNIALIGAYGDDDKGAFSGSAYIFIRAADGTWSQQAKLTASDGAAYAYFGFSVSVSGGTALVGAYNANNKGSAYAFVQAANGSWIQQARLAASDGAYYDNFGGAVTIAGNTALVGAYGANSSTGSAYVFVRATDGTWNQQQKLTASDGTASDYFGRAVSLSVSGDTALVGAPGIDIIDPKYSPSSKGLAYVFVRAADGTWNQQQKLTADYGAASDYFGYSTSLSGSGDTALIGACGTDDKGSMSGSAYVFARSGSAWSQQIKLVASDGSSDDWFGFSVSASDGALLVGARNAYGTNGSVYVYPTANATTKINVVPAISLLLMR